MAFDRGRSVAAEIRAGTQRAPGDPSGGEVKPCQTAQGRLPGLPVPKKPVGGLEPGRIPDVPGCLIRLCCSVAGRHIEEPHMEVELFREVARFLSKLEPIQQELESIYDRRLLAVTQSD